MKIINFKKHDEPLDCGGRDKRVEIASFDIEFSVGGMQLVWHGWSVRQVRKYRFLQAPQNSKWSSLSRGPSVLIKGQDPALVVQMIRGMLFKEYGIESTERNKPPLKTEPNPIPDEKPKAPEIKKKVSK